MNRSVSDNDSRRKAADSGLKAMRKSEPAGQTPSEAPQAAPAEQTYTVVAGDTLSEIGELFGVDYLRIAEVNQIANPDLINVGQVLVIPC